MIPNVILMRSQFACRSLDVSRFTFTTLSHVGSCTMTQQQVEASPLKALFDMPEIAANIFGLVETPAELAALARVNRAFCAMSRKVLYGTIKLRTSKYHQGYLYPVPN